MKKAIVYVTKRNQHSYDLLVDKLIKEGYNVVIEHIDETTKFKGYEITNIIFDETKEK